MSTTDQPLPPGTYEAADEAFENWQDHEGDDELEAALLAAAPLIRTDERQRYEDRIATLKALAAQTRQAADGYDPPDRDLTDKAAALELAVEVMEGTAGGEGLAP